MFFFAAFFYLILNCSGADFQINLDSNDGSSAFLIKNSSKTSVFSIDSDGNTVIRGGLRLDASGVKCASSETVIVDGAVLAGTETGPSSGVSARGQIRSGTDLTSYADIGHGGSNAYFNWEGTGNLQFRFNNSPLMELDQNGNLNIRGGLRVDSGKIYPTVAERLIIDGNLLVNTEDLIEKLTISGCIALLETTAPASDTANYGKLYAGSSDSKLYFRDDSGNEYAVSQKNGDFSNNGDSSGSNRTLGNTDAWSLGLLTSGVSRLVISSAGNVGINTVSPGTSLEVTGDIAAQGMLISSAANPQSYLSTVTASSWTQSLSVPVYIPPGTSSLKGKITYLSTNGMLNGTGYVRLKCGANTSGQDSTGLVNTWVTSGVLSVNVSSSGWQSLIIEGYNSLGYQIQIREFIVTSGK